MKACKNKLGIKLVLLKVLKKWIKKNYKKFKKKKWINSNLCIY